MSANEGSVLPISLQINVSPRDLPPARHILPHQLHMFAHHCDETLLVSDEVPSRGAFATGNWEDAQQRLTDLFDQLHDQYPRVRSVKVDYSSRAVGDVGERFFGRPTVPQKDYRGGPFYSYFYGLQACRHDWVFHLDSDMMFGGEAAVWLREALQEMREDPTIFCCHPLPGPPYWKDGEREIKQRYVRKHNGGFLFHKFSTRLFFCNRTRLYGRLQVKYVIAPTRIIEALRGKQRPYELAEKLITAYMRRHRLRRYDFAGSGSGLWSIHPLVKDQRFSDRLPVILESLRNEEVPDEQRGRYNLIDTDHFVGPEE